MEPLDQHRERIQEDLRGLIAGDVRCDDLFVQLYASDGSIHQIRPLGVVRPRSTADVSTCVQYAAEKGIAIHARGAGSGLAGESLGKGLILDFSTHMRRILHHDAETVRVQPGVVHERLNAHLARRGRFFGPDPGTTAVTTVGSLLALGGAGPHWLRYGTPRERVRSMQVVLADGQVLECGREPLVDGRSKDSLFRKRRLVNRLAKLLKDHAALIRRKVSQSPVNRCGYRLDDVLGPDYLDLARLLVGTEGTLALTTEATLATDPVPRYRGLAILLFDSLEKAARAVQDVLPYEPSACDLMERRYLSLAREIEVRLDLLIPSRTEAVLLVEQEGDDQHEVRDRLQRLTDEVLRKKQRAFDARQSFEPTEMNVFRQLAAKLRPALFQMGGSTRPVPVVADMAVPPETLPAFLVRVQNVLKRHQVTASVSCHAGQGQLHVQPFLDLTEDRDIRTMRALADELYGEVFRVGGTISGERGCGLSRTPFVARQYGELYDVFRKIKHIFDPNGVFNPEKVVTDEPGSLDGDLRPAPEASPPESDMAEEVFLPEGKSPFALQMPWERAEAAGAAERCTGCGECRSQAPDARMCPIFRVLRSEEASPRAKANLLRGVFSGQLDPARLTGEDMKAIADLCVHCYMCPLECPAGVDIPKLAAEMKGAYVAANGLGPSDWAMTRLDLIVGAASIARPVVNWALGWRPSRWLLEKTLGIARGRKLPRIAARSFLRQVARDRLDKPVRHAGHKVAYFVDHYANWHDPELARALVAVMKHNGISVYVPADQRPSGMAAVTCGALDHARRLARHNVALLAEAVRQGHHIVATEPSAALCLIREYPNLLDDDDARLVAENTSEACAYLWRFHMEGKLLLDLKPIPATVGYHMPCRLKALEVGAPGRNLLRLIPGFSVHVIEAGCSGMAGTFGLKQQNYRTSLRAGWGLISRLRESHLQAGATECSACKIQMEQGTTKPTVHPIRLLALAYGLTEEKTSPLETPSGELLVT